MGNTVTEKILSSHLVSGTLEPGNEIAVAIDQTLTQDATGTMVYLQFESMKIPRVKTELSVSYIDHNTLQSDFKNMDDHLYLQSIAKKHGIYFSRPGNGICHQVHLERFGRPGKTLLGSDSHTPTAGGIGMIAIGAGGLDIARALAGTPFYLTCPEIIGVHLTGSLQYMCSAKDIILAVLQKETVKGGVGKIYEYFGPGVGNLSVPQRSTITNMGAELGATTSIFPSDDHTRGQLLKMQQREGWQEIVADEDCSFSRVIELDLDTLEPLCAQPHMPDNVVPVSQVAGKKVHQVAVGSCTNSSINDLGIAADILQGSTIAENVSMAVSPGSRQVLNSALKAGIIEKLVESGARFLENACGPCIGMGFAPASGSVSLRTFNRNFKGRSGTKDAQVYLVSPETAAASALKGEITDPRSLPPIRPADYTSFVSPDEKMIISPADQAEADDIEIIRGPNIQPCPAGTPFPDTYRGSVLLKTEDNITTDHIMPAGAKILPLRSNIPEISRYTFEAVDPEFYSRAKEREGGIIVGGHNYGQGSSREHAALAPMYLGIRIVCALSFARNHKANLINFGIVPLTFKEQTDYDRIQRDHMLAFPNIMEELKNSTGVTGRNETEGYDFLLNHDLEPRQIEILKAGGLLNFTRKEMPE